jgi:hypothetical protein
VPIWRGRSWRCAWRRFALTHSVLAIFRTGAVVEASTRLVWQQRHLDAETEPIVFDREDADDRAVERMSTAAADDGYCVQLLDLAALRGACTCERSTPCTRSR